MWFVSLGTTTLGPVDVNAAQRRLPDRTARGGEPPHLNAEHGYGRKGAWTIPLLICRPVLVRSRRVIALVLTSIPNQIEGAIVGVTGDQVRAVGCESDVPAVGRDPDREVAEVAAVNHHSSAGDSIPAPNGVPLAEVRDAVGNVMRIRGESPGLCAETADAGRADGRLVVQDEAEFLLSDDEPPPVRRERRRQAGTEPGANRAGGVQGTVADIRAFIEIGAVGARRGVGLAERDPAAVIADTRGHQPAIRRSVMKLAAVGPETDPNRPSAAAVANEHIYVAIPVRLLLAVPRGERARGG